MTVFANFFILVSHLKEKLLLYLNNCLLDTHETARKRNRTAESTFISADPVRRFSNLSNLEIFSLTVRVAFNWHESERLSKKISPERKKSWRI